MVQMPNSSEIKKLKNGETFKSIFVVKAITPKQDRNGRTYHEVAVTDSAGTLEAKAWGDASWMDRTGERADTNLPAIKIEDSAIVKLVGKSVGIDGKVVEYRGQNQYNFTKITLLDQEKFPPSGYLPHSPIDRDKLCKRFGELVGQCRKEIADFLNFAFKSEILGKFFDWPAAVGNHHAYACGLAEHSISVADSARASALAMERSGYKVDADVVTAGALLHDIGKLRAYKMETIPEITLEGAVIDHVALGYCMFEELALKFNLSASLKLQLAHIIISHHGIKEYGSPVVPETAEAMIVASADELDFRMFCWHDSVKDMSEKEEISAWNNPTQRRFWNVR